VIVRVLERFADRRHDRERLLGCETPSLHRLPEIHPVDKLHEQVEESACLPEIVHGHDVRMAESGEGACLPLEALGEVLIRAGRRCEDLQCHEAIELRLPRLVDGTHPSLADEAEDFKLGKGGAHGVEIRSRASGARFTSRLHHAGHEAARTKALRRGSG